MGRNELLTPQEREIQRLISGVGQGSMSWSVLSKNNADETAFLLSYLFEGHKVFYKRIAEETKDENFSNQLPILGGKAVERVVQFWSDPVRWPYHFIAVRFASVDTEQPYEVRIAENQQFFLNSGQSSVPALVLRKFMYPSYNSAVRAHYTGDDGDGRWYQEFYIGMPL